MIRLAMKDRGVIVGWRVIESDRRGTIVMLAVSCGTFCKRLLAHLL
jgi:hypothetical protein